MQEACGVPLCWAGWGTDHSCSRPIAGSMLAKNGAADILTGANSSGLGIRDATMRCIQRRCSAREWKLLEALRWKRLKALFIVTLCVLRNRRYSGPTGACSFVTVVPLCQVVVRSNGCAISDGNSNAVGVLDSL